MKQLLTGRDKLAGRLALTIYFSKTNIYSNFVKVISSMEIYYKVFGFVRGKVDNIIYEKIARAVHRKG